MCYSPHKLSLLPLILLALTIPTFAQKKSRIAKIEFTGLNRISAEELRETTGLKIGQAFDISTLDAAAQRLSDSGLFKNVAYSTRANGDQINITFQVDETRRESSPE